MSAGDQNPIKQVFDYTERLFYSNYECEIKNFKKCKLEMLKTEKVTIKETNSQW